MKLALIPPFCMSHLMHLTDYQLVLPECFRDEGYTRAIYDMRQGHPSRGGHHIILDNGAAEGKAWHPQALLAIGHEFKVDEIVIPDELTDMEITLDMLEWFEKETTVKDRSWLDFMAVVQGTNMSQIMQCAETFLLHDFITCIGIPRHLLTTLGDKYARIKVAQEIEHRFPRKKHHYDIHFLGTNPAWYAEAKELKLFIPWARGLDTSLPFIGGYHGELIDEIDLPPMHRPDHYFETPYPMFSRTVVDHNIGLLKGWLRG